MSQPINLRIYVEPEDAYEHILSIFLDGKDIMAYRLDVADRVDVARRFREAAEQLMTGLDNLE